MKQSLVKVKLHNVLGEQIGNEWKLAVKTVGAAMNAIDVLSKRKFFKFLLEQDKLGVKYSVLINGREFIHDKENPPNIDNPQSITNSELCAKINRLETIDIVPVIQGSGNTFANIFSIILGVVLIAVGFIISIGSGGLLTPFGAVLVVAGLGLLAAGIINLLSKGPELDEFKDRQKTSFLFSGPVNTINEGGCVPVGYGEVMIGSSVISASYDIGYFSADDNSRVVQQ